MLYAFLVYMFTFKEKRNYSFLNESILQDTWSWSVMLEGLSEIKAEVRSPLVKPPGEPPLFLKRSVAEQRSQSSSCYGLEINTA